MVNMVQDSIRWIHVSCNLFGSTLTRAEQQR